MLEESPTVDLLLRMHNDIRDKLGRGECSLVVRSAQGAASELDELMADPDAHRYIVVSDPDATV